MDHLLESRFSKAIPDRVCGQSCGRSPLSATRDHIFPAVLRWLTSDRAGTTGSAVWVLTTGIVGNYSAPGALACQLTEWALCGTRRGRTGSPGRRRPASDNTREAGTINRRTPVGSLSAATGRSHALLFRFGRCPHREPVLVGATYVCSFIFTPLGSPVFRMVEIQLTMGQKALPRKTAR